MAPALTKAQLALPRTQREWGGTQHSTQDSTAHKTAVVHRSPSGM
jgi:hypothetical protein